MPRFELSDALLLRPLEEADADELYELVDRNRAYLARWMPWATTQTAAGTLAFIRATIEQEQLDEGFQVALVDRDEIAGVLGYHRLDRENAVTAIGYWLAEDRQRRGLMTAAVGCLVDHAFHEWALNRVEIRASPDNRRSRALAERLGFREEGVLREAERWGDQFRDLVLYSLLASERPRV